MRYKVSAVCFVAGCFLAMGALLAAEKFHLNPSPSVPGATGMVDVDKDGNGNTTLNIHIEHLAKAPDLSPPKTAYVVWTQGPDLPPANIGELNVNRDLKADLKTVSSLHNFKLFVTAEDNPRVTAPRGPVVMTADIQRP